MANNVFQVKRTNVSGRTPNTTGSYGTNSQYIAAGEFALNMADGILYTSNGSVVITVGANLVNQNITGNLTVKAIIANGSIGTANQVLTTNSTGVYWSTVEGGGGSGTVTQVNTGIGLTGGPITTNGTISVLPNTGIVANSTGLFVNATYIGTLTANNTSFVGTVSAANVVSNAQLSSNLSSYQTTAGLSANVATLTANNANFVKANNGITSNSSGVFVAQGTGTVVNATGVHVNATYIGTISSNNASFLGGTAAASYQLNSTLSANVATLTSNNSTFSYGKTEGALNVNSALTANNSTNLGGVAASGYQTTAGLSANVATLTSNNATNLNGQPATFYTNATNITTGTLPYAQIPANIINTTAAFTRTGITTFSANVVLGTSGLSANGEFGTAGHTLHSNGTATYWGADDQGVTSVATGNGMTGGPITTTGTVSVLANTGVVANSTGLFVNSAYIGTLTANNTSFVGTVSAANVVSNAQLSGNLANYQTTAGLSANVATLTSNNSTFSYGKTEGALNVNSALTANNSTNLGGVAAASYVQNTDSRTLSGNLVFSGANVTSSGNFRLSGGLIANGSLGTASHVLHSNGTSVYWAADDQGVTSVATGNGMTGGAITSTGTVSILANTGIVANATGTYVNATYIATLSANNTTYVNGKTEGNLNVNNATTAYGKTEGNLNVNSAIYANASVTNTFTVGTASYFVSNGNVGIGNTAPAYKLRVDGNISLSGGIHANGGFGTSGQVLTTNGTAAYWTAAAGGGYYKGGSAAVGTLAVGGQNLFRVNANTLNYNTTIATGENAQATGPIAVASGITLTVESGARVAIV